MKISQTTVLKPLSNDSWLKKNQYLDLLIEDQSLNVRRERERDGERERHIYSVYYTHTLIYEREGRNSEIIVFGLVLCHFAGRGSKI